MCHAKSTNLFLITKLLYNINISTSCLRTNLNVRICDSAAADQGCAHRDRHSFDLTE